MGNIPYKSNLFKVKSLGLNYSKITINPLKVGYGHTMGNALRRILLSSLSGYAVTEVYFYNVLHEYCSLKGVKEDVMDILLNLKGIIFELHDCKEVLLLLEKRDKKIILASDIFLPYNVEIINPNHVIANLTLETSLKLQMVVKKGKGYAEKKKKQSNVNINAIDVGKFSLEASFSPIRRVFYEVETYFIKDKKFDKLMIYIETNGLLSPKDALQKSINKFLKDLKYLSTLKEERRCENYLFQKEIDSLYLQKINILKLSIKSLNYLKIENIFYIGDLIQKTERELLQNINFGNKFLEKIKTALLEYDLHLNTSIKDWDRKKKKNIKMMKKKKKEKNNLIKV